ncbi:hypothetical protein ACJMK2_008182 [Sinanodonta woodiana]|uniref:Uncharacterized protein n=1 Tax=Sinanodonta woodiana TaxID=1069815 RepID=A0ABD3VP23_SINWO
MTGMAGKRKYEEDFIICVSKITKCGKSNKKICNNRMLEYSTECTWDDVYHDITNDTDFCPHRADVLNVSLSDKLDGTMTFHPDLHEGLHVTKLTARDQRALTCTLEKYDYTCGSVITPDGDIQQGKVFVRLQLSCAVHIEFPYYASNIGGPDICAHCGAIGAEKSQEMTGRFRTVLPVCQQCLASGKVIPKQNPVKN